MKEPGRRVGVTGAHKEGVTGVAWLDGKDGEGGGRVLSAGADATVKVWEVGEKRK